MNNKVFNQLLIISSVINSVVYQLPNNSELKFHISDYLFESPLLWFALVLQLAFNKKFSRTAIQGYTHGEHAPAFAQMRTRL